MSETTTYSRLWTALASVVAAGVMGCNSAPDEPTWIDDVRPILAANCIRCHGAPAIGGAPPTFRLDTYTGVRNMDGTVTLGAVDMARFVAIRAGEIGDMPPDSPRTDTQRDTLINWFENSSRARGTREGNRPPEVQLDQPVPDTWDDSLTEVDLSYLIVDPDGDLVTGSFVVTCNDGGDTCPNGWAWPVRACERFSAMGRDLCVAADIHSGRGHASFDPSTLPEGDYQLFALLTDDVERFEIEIASFRVIRDAGNAAPTVHTTAPAPYEIIADRDYPFTLTAEVQDPDDADDALSVTFRACATERCIPDEAITIAENVSVEGGVATAMWCREGDANTDCQFFADLDEGTRWRVQSIARDGSATSSHVSLPFVVSEAQPTLGFDDVERIFVLSCSPCHSLSGVHATVLRTYADVYPERGRILLRAVRQQTMPPESAAAINITTDSGTVVPIAPLSPSDRAMLESWLLSGAPE